VGSGVQHHHATYALAEGANFRSDKIFARETPVLRVERNVLESPEHWELVVEVSIATWLRPGQ